MLKHDVQSRWCLWHAARFNQFPVLVKAKCISLEDHDRARIAPEMDDVPVPKPEWRLKPLRCPADCGSADLREEAPSGRHQEFPSVHAIGHVATVEEDSGVAAWEQGAVVDIVKEVLIQLPIRQLLVVEEDYPAVSMRGEHRVVERMARKNQILEDSLEFRDAANVVGHFAFLGFPYGAYCAVSPPCAVDEQGFAMLSHDQDRHRSRQYRRRRTSCRDDRAVIAAYVATKSPLDSVETDAAGQRGGMSRSPVCAVFSLRARPGDAAERRG